MTLHFFWVVVYSYPCWPEIFWNIVFCSQRLWTEIGAHLLSYKTDCSNWTSSSWDKKSLKHRAFLNVFEIRPWFASIGRLKQCSPNCQALYIFIFDLVFFYFFVDDCGTNTSCNRQYSFILLSTTFTFDWLLFIHKTVRYIQYIHCLCVCRGITDSILIILEWNGILNVLYI